MQATITAVRPLYPASLMAIAMGTIMICLGIAVMELTVWIGVFVCVLVGLQIGSFRLQEKYGFAPVIARYNIACCYAVTGQMDEAFAALDGAIDVGLEDADQVIHDPDLRSLRSDARFDAVVRRLNHQSDETYGADRT